MTPKAILDKVIVTPVNDESEIWGIVIEAREGKPEKGIIVSVGLWRVLENGTREPMDVKVWDVVYFTRYATDEIKIDGKNYYTLKQSSILSIIEE